MPTEITPSPHPSFHPEDFGFFLRPDWKLADVAFYEKDHDSIDRSKEKDWMRLNLYLSKSDNFVCIWYGVIDPAIADMAYSEKHGFTWTDTNEDETLFRGYIENRAEAEVILRAIRWKGYFPQYLG